MPFSIASSRASCVYVCFPKRFRRKAHSLLYALKPHCVSVNFCLARKEIIFVKTLLPNFLIAGIFGERLFSLNLVHVTRSAFPSRIGAISFGMSPALNCPSASIFTIMPAPIFKAFSIPVLNATPRPRFEECETTKFAPAFLASFAVLSVLPSLTTRTFISLIPGIFFGISETTLRIVFSSLKAGIRTTSRIVNTFKNKFSLSCISRG